jgi:tripartite-type tricarboxylate transporter receptor subunit TctC
MKKLICVPLWISLFVLTFPAFAQNYPNRPVRLILPYTPGGGTDLIARPLAEKLSGNLGQQVIIDNRGGANGNIGMELVAKASPDGYTLVLALTAQLAINPAFYPKLSYDPARDYAPITLLGTSPYLLTVNPSLPVKSVKELIALAKAKPGQLTFATSGTGGIPHLAGELLKSMAGIDMVHVPYKGGGPALVDVIGGQVHMNFAVIPVAMTHVRTGRLRAIAVTGAKRFPGIPDVPTISETLPGYAISTWFGVLAPARTPRPVVDRLNREIVTVLAHPDMRANQLANGFEPIGSTPDQLAQYIRSEIVKWAKVVKESGVKPDKPTFR